MFLNQEEDLDFNENLETFTPNLESSSSPAKIHRKWLKLFTFIKSKLNEGKYHLDTSAVNEETLIKLRHHYYDYTCKSKVHPTM